MKQSTALKPIVNLRKEKVFKKIFIAGTGAVGGTLLKQIRSLNGSEPLQVIGICNSNHQKFYSGFEAPDSSDLYRTADPISWESILIRLTDYEPGSVVFVDATGSPDVADLYPVILDNNIHVVTPSKLANSRSYEQFNELHKLAERNGVSFRYETNVGAGLPVLDTLKKMVDTGDEIVEISGVVSGTMTYIFSELDKGNSFSETVLNARMLGYAEPDPRDDLSGEDVARKFLILARICGHEIERDELEVESLIPEPLRDADAAAFLEKLPEYDRQWKERLDREQQSGFRIRYTGRFSESKIRIKAEAVPAESPLGRLTGTNNLIEIKTRRYFDQPLIIQGPGAGKEVTAAGVLGEILEIK